MWNLIKVGALAAPFKFGIHFMHPFTIRIWSNLSNGCMLGYYRETTSRSNERRFSLEFIYRWSYS